MMCSQAPLAGEWDGVGFISKQATRWMEPSFLLPFALQFGSGLRPAGKHSTLPTIMAPSQGLMTSITDRPHGELLA